MAGLKSSPSRAQTNITGSFTSAEMIPCLTRPTPLPAPSPATIRRSTAETSVARLGKKASFFFQYRAPEYQRSCRHQRHHPRSHDIASVIPFTEAVPNPSTRTNLSPRLDYQISKNNTLTARYQYYPRHSEPTTESASSTLRRRPTTAESTEHTLQISDTQIFGAKIVNETRFQYLRESDSQLPVSTDAGESTCWERSRAAATTGHDH